MSIPTSKTIPTTHVVEKTFRSYNSDQGKFYAQNRRDYHPSVYQFVLDQHSSTGGELDLLLDVGCGPGMAARALAPNFAIVYGLDPSEGMIATARTLEGGITSTGEPIRFEISSAEELGATLNPPVQDGSVDLITASNAAHWFDMPSFWRRAARVLKPGGSVALWTSGRPSVDPSMPNAAKIQAAMDRFRSQQLEPYNTPGNVLAGDGYINLPLPWTMNPAAPEFDESSFVRKEWDPANPFHTDRLDVDLDGFEKMFSTGSAVTRWRQAHPDDVGTDRDILKMVRREVESLLHEAGVEPGKERLKGAGRGVVLIVKKKTAE